MSFPKKGRKFRTVSGKTFRKSSGRVAASDGYKFAAVIAESEAFGYLDAPIVRLAGRDMPIPYNRTLEYHTVPQVENIVEKARDLVQMRI